MYATNYTYVIIRAVYQMPHAEPLTVEPLTRPVESTLEGNNCIAVFVMNQAEEVGSSWRTVHNRAAAGAFSKTKFKHR